MTDAVTGAGPNLVDYRMRLPDDSWGSWNPGSGADAVAAGLALRLADGPAAQAVVRRSVITINANALTKGNAVVTEAIWVPDRTTGEVMATMELKVRSFRDGLATPEAYLARDVKKDAGRRARILEYAARTSEVPAGALTIEQFLLRLRRERLVQGYLFLLIFPPDIQEAVWLTFNTPHLALLTTIAEQARIIADSVTVTLGKITDANASDGRP